MGLCVCVCVCLCVCVCRRLKSIKYGTDIHIYIHMHTCVCVCVCARARMTYLCVWYIFTCHKRSIHMSKDALFMLKRGQSIWQKGPIRMAKETQSYDKGRLLIWQTRPIHMTKDACFELKRGVSMWQKSPTTSRPKKADSERSLNPKP